MTNTYIRSYLLLRFKISTFTPLKLLILGYTIRENSLFSLFPFSFKFNYQVFPKISSIASRETQLYRQGYNLLKEKKASP